VVNKQCYWQDIGTLAKFVRENRAGCQGLGKTMIISKALKPIPVFGMLHRWHVDLFGPLPRTLAGNRYGIVAIDSVSKWVEAGAIPNKSADCVKR
jgi:hypothetical protein